MTEGSCILLTTPSSYQVNVRHGAARESPGVHDEHIDDGPRHPSEAVCHGPQARGLERSLLRHAEAEQLLRHGGEAGLLRPRADARAEVRLPIGTGSPR
jgi:hypothetical protein